MMQTVGRRACGVALSLWIVGVIVAALFAAIRNDVEIYSLPVLGLLIVGLPAALGFMLYAGRLAGKRLSKWVISSAGVIAAAVLVLAAIDHHMAMKRFEANQAELVASGQCDDDKLRAMTPTVRNWMDAQCGKRGAIDHGYQQSYSSQSGQIAAKAEAHFYVATPDGWGEAPLVGRMAWHVASNGGTEQPDCGVIVSKDASFLAAGADGYIDNQSKEQLKEMLSLNFQDVVIGSWNTNSELGGQRALQHVYSGSMDGERQTTMTIQTVREDRLYSFFCNAPADVFPTIYLKLLRVSDTFSFR
ncbi:hypothetical protein [Luteimonas sp. MC1750]|uniref:hypothetical protein n=1 Tax=Luteimonas sp. MC1750 TaxID=2799326 RepID=UPI0018F0ADC4|nr:hypothetical protein [Luteimonas sp. MC1750]MBJ6985753.1 hypothetical protein [Luteimonas sp. MC1750]QQO05920.1 hypothetical protein JGR68_00185 [Luteimonas sp. MC1750]